MEKNIEVTRTKKTEKKNVAKSIAIGAGIVVGSMVVGGVVTYLVVYNEIKDFRHVADLSMVTIKTLRENENIHRFTIRSGKTGEILRKPLNIFKHNLKSVSYVNFFDEAGNDITKLV